MADDEVERLQKLVSEIPDDIELDEEIINKILNSNEKQDEEIKKSKSR